MKNLLNLWNEVVQGENVLSSKSIETSLQFPKGISLNQFVYSSLKIITTENQPRSFSSIVSNLCDALITRREKTGDEIYAAHVDVLNYLRGIYVKEHNN